MKRLGRMFTTKNLTKAHPLLEKHASIFSGMLNDFSLKVEKVIMKYGKNIIGNELPQRRIANMAIELYVSLATLTRTSSILANETISQADKDYVMNLSGIVLRESRQEFVKNLKRLDENFDKTLPEASKGVCERDGYGLDVINF
jgi:acyl-CoA dehydrogenase family protein 9